MEKNRTIIFLFLTLMLTLALGQLASAEWKKNIVTNRTTADVFVIYSTRLGRNTKRNIPAGYRTVGYYRIPAGQQRSFWAWANNSIYFRILKKSGKAIKPLSSTPTISFWGHPRRSHIIVTRRAISVPVTTDQLYTNRNKTELVKRDGFIKYANGSRVTVSPAWVYVEPPAEPQPREGTVTFVSKRRSGIFPEWYTATIEVDIPNCTKVLSFATQTEVSTADDPYVDEENLTVEQLSDTRLKLTVRLREHVGVDPYRLKVKIRAWCQVSANASGAPSLQPQLRPEAHLLTEIWQELSRDPPETVLLSNYPNPFNPETWIPYHLADPAHVVLTIYSVDGKVVRRLDLGHQTAGIYQSKSRAAYWDGRNAVGERVVSGLYFYTLTAGDFTATGKMLIIE